jgi:hypothetical protein
MRAPCRSRAASIVACEKAPKRRRTKETIMEATLVRSRGLSSSVAMRWLGYALTVITVLFLSFDIVIKFANVPEVAEASAQLGLPLSLAPICGVILLGCLILYLIPRTAPLGAVLMTGYLGGAVLVHLRVGDPLFTHTLFPIYVGAFLWFGLYVRDARVRRLLGPR